MFPLEGLSNYPEFQLINLTSRHEAKMKCDCPGLRWNTLNFGKFFLNRPQLLYFLMNFWLNPKIVRSLSQSPF